ncbi:MAG: DOMON domain protein [Deinococcus-Thermus bacterium]|jgi:hypothetical protein|nr:DOMON domain protein [Deinococcota bacterium]
MTKYIATLALALLVSFGLAQTVDGTIGADEYASSASHEESGAEMHWTVMDDTLYFAMTIDSRGWAGIGWATEQTRNKRGFDQLIFTVQDGEAVALDMYQDGARGAPAMDEAEGGSNSLTEFAGAHEGETWTVEFARPLDTGEDVDVAIMPGEEMIFDLAVADVMDVERRHDRSSRGGAFYIDPFVF